MSTVIFEKTSPDAKLPERANSTDSGLDLFTPQDVEILPGDDALIPLDLRVQLPEGMDMQVCNKSGRATKNKLIVGAEIIDNSYRGIIHVHLFNIGKQSVLLKKGEKIAQGIIRRVETLSPTEGKVNMETDRGEGGFGSSGLA